MEDFDFPPYQSGDYEDWENLNREIEEARQRRVREYESQSFLPQQQRDRQESEELQRRERAAAEMIGEYESQSFLPQQQRDRQESEELQRRERAAAEMIGEFYLDKLEMNYESAREEILRLQISRVVCPKLNEIEIHLRCPGLLIGRRGVNITALEAYVRNNSVLFDSTTKIKIIEDTLNDYLLPYRWDEDWDGVPVKQKKPRREVRGKQPEPKRRRIKIDRT